MLLPTRAWLWVIGVVSVLVLGMPSMASADNVLDEEALPTETYAAEATTSKGDTQEFTTENSVASEKVLSRHRRYLVFPEGSTFTCAFCLTLKTYMIRDYDIFTTGVAWGISYDLPNNSREIASAGAGIGPDDLRRKGQRQGRRDRRDLYRRFETAADSAGLDGRACVLRAVCESRDLPGEKQKAPKSLPLELLRTVLDVPVDALSSHEPYEHHEYAMARRLGIEGADCERHYPSCPTSFVSMATNLVPIVNAHT